VREGITYATNFSKNSKIQSLYAWGLLQEGEIEKADSTSKKAIQLSSKNQLAKNVQKEIYLARAKKFSNLGQTTQALENYGKALKFDPENFEISKSMALLIFDFYKGESSKNSKAYKSDMTKVSRMLAPSLKQENLEITSLLILIEAARNSNQFKIGTQACITYEKNFGSIKISDRILDCAKMWVATGKRNLARDLLQKSLNQNDLEGSKENLSQYLLKIL
jgi:Tfp pilus assembly protein PilF